MYIHTIHMYSPLPCSLARLIGGWWGGGGWKISYAPSSKYHVLHSLAFPYIRSGEVENFDCVCSYSRMYVCMRRKEERSKKKKKHQANTHSLHPILEEGEKGEHGGQSHILVGKELWRLFFWLIVGTGLVRRYFTLGGFNSYVFANQFMFRSYRT